MLGVLKVENSVARNDAFRVFGPAILEENVAWPLNPDGQPMLLFVGVPAYLLNAAFDKNLYCNVFMTYDPIEETHIYDMNEFEADCEKYSVVILSDLRKSKIKKYRCIEPAKNLVVDAAFTEDVPYWLQDPIQMDGLAYGFQLSGLVLEKICPNQFGDEEYYVLFNEGLTKGNVFVQTT